MGELGREPLQRRLLSGRPADALLVEAGEKGEIVNVGTHVETDTRIYLVEFKEKIVVGCFEEEIDAISRTP